jgi:hypothetical protein
MIPTGLFPMNWVIHLQADVRRLEEELDLALSLIVQLTRHLRPFLGEHALEPALEGILQAADVERQNKLQAVIESLLPQGQEPNVVRQLRDATGLAWDDIYSLFSSWPSFTTAEKHRWLRRHLYRNAKQMPAS